MRSKYYDGLLDEATASRGYKRLWSAERLRTYRDSFHALKGNKQVCGTTVAMTQNMLLARTAATWTTSSTRFGRSRPTRRTGEGGELSAAASRDAARATGSQGGIPDPQRISSRARSSGDGIGAIEDRQLSREA